MYWRQNLKIQGLFKSIVQFFKISSLNPAGRALIVFVVVILGLAFLFPPTPRPVDWEQATFATTASSQLYFKNVRSFYYRIDPDSKAPFILYRFKRYPAEGSAAVHFMIMENRSVDEAYIFAEANEAMKQLSAPALYFPAVQQFPGDTLRLEDLNREGHFALAARVLWHLKEERPVVLLDGRQPLHQLWKPAYDSRADEWVLKDFFKLVNKY